MRAAAVVLLFFAFFASSAFGADCVPIATARTMAAGSEVTVIGLVTVLPGSFTSSTSDAGFAIQDQTGGIWIAAKTSMKLRRDQKVQVTGTLAESNAKLQIVPTKIEPLPGRDLRVATGMVAAPILGFIITIEGTISARGVVDDLPYGYKFFVDDGSGAAQVYISASTDIDPKLLKAGRRVRVTGFASRYDATFEVEARSPRDIQLLR